MVRGVPTALYGHTAPVTVLCVVHTFSLLVSAARDGTIILWDLNHLTFIRSITTGSEVVALTVSDTLGDIASVCPDSG